MVIIGRLPTIPEYYKMYINSNVDLTVEPKQCCPFHKEDTPSWSYSADRQRWRCFGACHVGGDVIDLHRINYHLKTKEEAEASLNALHKVPRKKSLNAIPNMVVIEESKVKFESVYAEACILANCPERWIELDYVMSKTPVEYIDLKNLVDDWNGLERI